MASWNNTYDGRTITSLLSAATAYSAVASGSYLDLSNVEGNMTAVIDQSGATNEAYSVTIGWLSGTSATGVAYTAATSGYNVTITGKGANLSTVMIPTSELAKRWIKPRITAITGSHILAVKMLYSYKAVRS